MTAVEHLVAEGFLSVFSIAMMIRQLRGAWTNGGLVSGSWVGLSLSKSRSIPSKRSHSTVAEAATPAKKLQGKVAIITGGASGIGASTARLFASNGAKVIIADVQDELGKQLSEELGLASRYFHCDVSNEQDVSAAVQLALSTFNKLDIMFNNAGVGHAGKFEQALFPITEIDASVLDHICNVNIKGTLFGVKHAAKAMISTNNRGCILNTCSVVAVIAQRTFHSYAVSKHAVLGITKTAASELCKHGIRINCISPSGILTSGSGFRKLLPSMSLEQLEHLFLTNSELSGTKLDTEDIANAALFLCSQDAKYITGHNLVVDGGLSVSRPINPLKNPHE